MFFRKHDQARQYALEQMGAAAANFAWVTYHGLQYKVTLGDVPSAKPLGAWEYTSLDQGTPQERTGRMRTYLDTLAQPRAGK